MPAAQSSPRDLGEFPCTPGSGLWTLESGVWTLDSGLWTVDVESRITRNSREFGNSEFPGFLDFFELLFFFSLSGLQHDVCLADATVTRERVLAAEAPLGSVYIFCFRTGK